MSLKARKAEDADPAGCAGAAPKTTS